MKDNNNHIKDELLIKYLTGNASENERIEVDSWIKLNNENALYLSKMQSIWQNSVNLEAYKEIDTESSLKNVKKRIEFNQRPIHKIKPLWMVVRIAAVLVVLFGFYLIFTQNDTIKKESKLTKIDSGNELKIVILPDSTVVSLNRTSHVEYAEDFGKGERRLRFDGEAYFEVKPDKLHPFVIETEQSETRVLGTAFNLKALKGSTSESIVVTQGMVEFSKKSDGQKQKVILEKGEKATVSDNLIKERNKDVNFMSWKTGIFIFNNESLPKALEIVSDYYHVKFRMQDSSLNTYTLNGKYEQLSLNDLISVLEMTLGLKFEKTSDTYILKK
jgi:ferric-dicitrate binding protein FerR (iron transport regulator)